MELEEIEKKVVIPNEQVILSKKGLYFTENILTLPAFEKCKVFQMILTILNIHSARCFVI